MLRILVAAACMAEPSAASAQVSEPDQFRMDHYRADTPATLRGGTVVHTDELARLLRAHSVLVIDVLPAEQPPPDERPGLPRMPLPHAAIPDSIWLPGVGRGALAPVEEARFRARLATLSANRRDARIAFTCLSRCWMSWNAARRAISYGYTRVLWYPDGVDGWRQAGLPTSVTTPAS